MSYDISFRPAGQDPEHAPETPGGDDERGLTPGELAVWEQLVAGVREVLGEIDADVEGGLAELSHDPTGIQVSLMPGEAFLSYPYWDHDDTEGFHRQVAAVVRTVERTTGYVAYDEQTGAPFDGVLHDEAGLAQTRMLRSEVAAHPTAPYGHGPAAAASGAAAAGPSDPAAYGRSRRRAWLYLLAGLVVVVGASWRLSTGEGSTFTSVLLVAGAAELAYGAVLMRRAIASSS